MTENFNRLKREGLPFFEKTRVKELSRPVRWCSRCDARLRRDKVEDEEFCDPFEAALRREWRPVVVIAGALDRLCKRGCDRPAVVGSGIYAWLCSDCREAERDVRRML